jgi:hypothetical protein
MKDNEAREVINLLNRRLKQLDRELQLLKSPHPKKCGCNDCTGCTPDHFCIKIRGLGWFNDGDET